ncbi:hypothetical protein PG994_001177 [Apiospora phragmitis]|uniref:Uncharacterized protein n=1 Tax=Apiospora phragmitis TaxID=2905665 RepID=A0ABR1WSU0_9PEZI
MSIETLSAPEPPEDGFELCRQQAQPGQALSCSVAIVTPAATPAHSALHRASAPVQTPGNSVSPRSSIRIPFSQHLSAIPAKFTQLWTSVWKEGKLQIYREAIVTSIAFAALLMAGVTLWPTITAASDGRKSELLTEWNTRKDFLSHCEERPVLYWTNRSIACYGIWADTQQNHGLQEGLRRRHAAHSSDGIDSTRLPNLTEWNIPSILGEAKGTGFADICHNEDGVSVPCLDLPTDEADSLQPSSAKINKHIYRPIQEQKYHARESECAASLGEQDNYFQDRRLFCTFLVLRPATGKQIPMFT